MAKYKAYPEYKDSGIEWLGKIPEHWKLSKLRYQFVFGKGLTITKEHLQDEGIPCVNYGDVHSKYGFEVDPEMHTLKCVSDKYLKDNANSLLAKGDIVYADTSEDIDGSGNFTQLVSDTVTFAGYHTIIARPIERENSRFYAYLLDCKELRSQVRHAVKGVKVFSITQAILRNLSIWLPSKDEQAQIASFLDHETAKIDKLIENQQQLIELLKEKNQAVISHAVTKGLNCDAQLKDSGVEWLGDVPDHWLVIKIKYLVNVFEQGWSPQCEARLAEKNEYGVLKVGCVNSGKFDPLEHKALPLNLEPQKQYLLKKNDLLISRANTRELVGSTAVAEKDYDNLIICDKLYRLKLKPIANPHFVCEFLRTPLVRQQIELAASGASHSMQNIGQDTIKEMTIALPPQNETASILKFFNNQIDKFVTLSDLSHRQIVILQERRTALISAAVTGKIDVRDWVEPEKQEVEELQETTV